MASDLKSFYNRNIVTGIAQDLKRAHPALKHDVFIAESLHGIDQLELIARAWHIAEAIARHLPKNFPLASKILIKSLRSATQRDAQATAPVATNDARDSTSMSVFRYLPHVFYVSKYGLDHFEESMRAQYELTQLFTAEFSIRAFFIKHPEATHARMLEWARDPNHHVRRLVSEGSRPRLPWAARLRAFQKDPAPVIALLELLKDDPELYVRRSVANNLNDIAKDNPDISIDVCRRWANNATPERMWIIRHALRSLVKQGHPGALAILGFASAPKIAIGNVHFTPKRVTIGDKLQFTFDLTSTAKHPQTLLIDYAVHFIKANGKSAPKVFKLSSVTLAPKQTTQLRTTVSFREMTTRKHYPGVHRIDALINGAAYSLGEVRVI